MIKAVQLFSLVMIVFIFSQNGEGKKDETVDKLAVEEKKERSIAANRVYQTRIQLMKTIDQQEEIIKDFLAAKDETQLKAAQKNYRKLKASSHYYD